MSRRERLGLLGAALGLVAGLCAAWAMVGHPAKLSGVITLFFAGFGGGASLTAILAGRRAERLRRDAAASATVRSAAGTNDGAGAT